MTKPTTKPAAETLTAAREALAFRAAERQPSTVRAARDAVEWFAARLSAGRDAVRIVGGGEWRLCGTERELRAAIRKLALAWSHWDAEVRGGA